MARTCKSCKIEKSDSFYYIKDKNTNRLDSTCKECRVSINTQYVAKNVDRVKEKHHSYYLENKEEILKTNKHNRTIKSQEYYEVKKIWRAENMDKVRGYRRKMKSKRKETDILYKLKENLRSRYSISLKVKSFNKCSKFKEYIGCELETLKSHLESLFTDDMTWDNYGLKGWHIDHIKPLDSAKTESELVPLLHYTNLQPLWAIDNYKKKNLCLNF